VEVFVSNRFKQILFCAFLLCCVALLLSGCGKKEAAVAKVGKLAVTVQDFKDGFIGKYRSEDAAAKKSFDDRKAFVQESADHLLLVAEAYSRGFDKKPVVTDQLDQLAARKSLDLLYQQEILDKVVTEEAMQNHYKHSAEELRGRHILLKTPPSDTSSVQVNAVKVRMDSIRQAVTRGLGFGEAAFRFSEDATTARDSGKLGWFSWGKMVDEFQAAAWNLKVGELSQPVRSPYGWHLILIDERRPVTQRPFEEMKKQIRDQMYRTEGEKLNRMAREYVANLRKEAKIEMRDDVWQMMRKKVEDPSAPQNKGLGNFFSEKEKELTAATYKGGKVTVKDIADKVGDRIQRVNWEDPNSFKDLVGGIIEPKLLEKDARDKGLIKKALKDPDILRQKEQQMATMLEKEEITDKVKVDSAEIQSYYQAHLGEFIQDEERTVREIFIKEDSAKAARIAARGRKGENFEKLAKQFNEKESTKNENGKIGPFAKRRTDVLGTSAFAMANIGDIAGPLSMGKNWSVIQLIEMTPSRTKSFDEVRSEAERQWRVAKTAELKDNLKKELAKKHPVTIYDDVLAKVAFGELQPATSRAVQDTVRAKK
jgi:parvulin-like peptidyl-prolyl isomerase